MSAVTWYVEGRNPKTKKALKELVENGEVYVYCESLVPVTVKAGEVAVSMPKYPEPHRAYARVQIDGSGRILKVIA